MIRRILKCDQLCLIRTTRAFPPPLSALGYWVSYSVEGSYLADSPRDQGIILTVLLAGLNQFFFFRYPSITISGFVSVLVALPMGRAWAAVRFLDDDDELWLIRHAYRSFPMRVSLEFLSTRVHSRSRSMCS